MSAREFQTGDAARGGEFEALCERLCERLAAGLGREVGAATAGGSGPRQSPAGGSGPREGAAGGVGARLKQAAVALVLRENAGRAELLIIKRAERERDHWSGHLALPGGRREASDADLVRTAVRETWEEVGLDLDDGGAVLGGLDVVRPQSPLAPQVEVWPFVAAAPPAYHVPEGGPAPRELVLNHEVAAAFWLPAALLRERGRSEVFRMVFGGRQLKWPAYASEHGPIWGITERILTNFLALAWGQET
ncbi:MAG TPA: CoA pyrophosphatase [Pyrinomonadaceae bacterium]|nr:CoA pyrophosphatase [Pyrinomonadaceae bacterium]